uniref:Uncharacterized protein n=1 Tax=Tanacetum cinerariifolium TaxID=118510 RepID=A0A699GWY1_TANCI|nr:hypothetical protein [Tanacetum cinerariifolium]
MIHYLVVRIDSEIKKLNKRVKKLEGKKKKRTYGLKRIYKGRITKIDADEDLSLINETAQDQGRMNDQDMFGVNDLDVTTADVNVSAALTTTTKTDDELTLAQTLIEIKAAKPKDLTTAATTITVVSIRPKEKGDIIDLEAQMQSDLEKDLRIAKQKEKEANIAMVTEWDNTKAMIDADYELAAKLQEE